MNTQRLIWKRIDGKVVRVMSAGTCYGCRNCLPLEVVRCLCLVK